MAILFISEPMMLKNTSKSFTMKFEIQEQSYRTLMKIGHLVYLLKHYFSDFSNWFFFLHVFSNSVSE